MSFEETFRGVLLEYLRRNGVAEATEVTHWEDDSEIRAGGYCPTCAWSETCYLVRIYYRTAESPPKNPVWHRRTNDFVWTYDGGFSELLNELIRIGESVGSRCLDPCPDGIACPLYDDDPARHRR